MRMTVRDVRNAGVQVPAADFAGVYVADKKVAAWLGKSTACLALWRKQGRFVEAKKIGGRWYYDRVLLARYIDSLREPARLMSAMTNNAVAQMSRDFIAESERISDAVDELDAMVDAK